MLREPIAYPISYGVVAAIASGLFNISFRVGILPGASGDYFSTPDSVAASITGDIDVRVRVALDDWTGASWQVLIENATTVAGISFEILANGKVALYWGTAGGLKNATSTVAPTIANGDTLWVRATLDVDNGADGYDAKFYTSTNGVNWTQLGTTVTVGSTTVIGNATVEVHIGRDNSDSGRVAGKIFRAQLYDGIDGTLNVDFDPNDWTSGSTFNSVETGELWTINGNASIR